MVGLQLTPGEVFVGRCRRRLDEGRVQPLEVGEIPGGDPVLEGVMGNVPT